jgi:hypothetical protein
MKVFLFFNGQTGHIPLNSNNWTLFKDPDSFKLAWICAESWKRNGWDVERFSTLQYPNYFTGRLAPSCLENSYCFNNFLPALRYYLFSQSGPYPDVWFTTTDVINNGFKASHAARFRPGGHLIPSTSFTLAAGRVNVARLNYMIHLLERYDRGEMKVYDGLQADETILRHLTKYSRLCRKFDYMGCATQQDKLLIHYSRSCLQWLAKPSELF